MTEREYLLFRLNLIYKYGENPGPARYVEVRNGTYVPTSN